MTLLLLATLAAATDLVEIPGDRTQRPFRIGAHEVTWAEYDRYAVAGKEPGVDGVTRPSQPDVVDPRAPFSNGVVQTPEFPARSVGRYGAHEYCAWLTKTEGRKYRLPTEREWERAARSKFAAKTGRHAGNSGGHTAPAAKGSPIADILGNVAELCLEPATAVGMDGVVRGGSWKTPMAKLTPKYRQPVDPEAWFEDDPKRPVRDWWFTDAGFVGLRVVSPDDDGLTAEERPMLARECVVENLSVADPGSAPRWIARITGMLRYGADIPADEIEVEAWFTDPDGQPLRIDPRGKPAYGMAWPVLASTAHRDGREKPLSKHETRAFTVFIPRPFDEVGPVPVGAPAAKVTWARLARY